MLLLKQFNTQAQAMRAASRLRLQRQEASTVGKFAVALIDGPLSAECRVRLNLGGWKLSEVGVQHVG